MNTDLTLQMQRERVSTRRRSERGAEIVEFALVLPVLLLIGLGICDFGMLFQRYEIVTNAAREGARAAAVGLSQAQIETVVEAYLAAGGLSDQPTIEVTTPDIGANPPVNVVRVTVAYPNGTFIVGPIAGIFGSSLQAVTLTSASTMRVEIQGS
jgi:Flp pilus assembly protein TadG